MMVYHGSPAQFEQFDYSKMGTQGTQEGKGFYFTDTPRIAKGYAQGGFLYSVNWKGIKPLSSENLTITRNEFKEYLIELDKQTDYLSNWGDVEYEGLSKVLESALSGEYRYAENDVDLICGVANASGSEETALRLAYEILGFDSIVTSAEWGGEQTLYIALVPDAFDIVDVQPVD